MYGHRYLCGCADADTEHVKCSVDADPDTNPNTTKLTRDSTGTVSVRYNVGSVRSRDIFCSGGGTCDLPYKKFVCGPWGKVESSKGENENSRCQCRSVPDT